MIDGLGRSLLFTTTAIAIVAATPATAQTRSFDVPAQAAETGIAALGRQADIQIVAARKYTKGKQTRAVRGPLSVEQALSQLLEGTGLVARSTGGQTYMVVPFAAGGQTADREAAQAGRGTIVGSLKEASTGAALKGARVLVRETGDVVASDELGQFRFANLPAGHVTLEVSYLGYPETSVRVEVIARETASAPIMLTAAGRDPEIIVMGQISARAQALNQQRTAENSTTVVSGDLLGNFNGTTISDSLRRAPGVSFLQNDQSGDGTNILLRGMSPDYNQVRLNGVALAETRGTGRAPDLSTLLSDAVSEIRISKTLLASQGGAGTGGLVEIETKSPLDRPRRYFNISVDGTQRGKGFGREYSASATGSLRFGPNDNFGVSASFQHRNQDLSTYSYSLNTILGPYLPLAANGLPARVNFLDPLMAFPFFDGADYYVATVSVARNSYQAETNNLTLGAEWQVDSATNLRLDYVRSDQRRDALSVKTFVSGGGSYQLNRPVPALGGALRTVYLAPASPVMSVNNDVQYDPDYTSKSDTVSFRGTTAFGALSLDFGAGYARGAESRPFSGSFTVDSRFTLSPGSPLIAPEAYNAAVGGIVTLFGPRSGTAVPVPLLTAAGYEALRNNLVTSNFQGLSAQQGIDGGSTQWNANLSAKYDLAGGILDYVEAGVRYDRRRFSSRAGSSIGYFHPDGGTPVSNVGLAFEEQSYAPVTGADTIYRSLSRASVIDLFSRMSDLERLGYEFSEVEFDSTLSRQQYTREEDLAGFAQGRLNLGRVEVIGGVRVELNRVDAFFVNGVRVTDAQGQFDQLYYDRTLRLEQGRGRTTNFLPRILANWRPQENLVFRAGYFSTVARPQIQLLNSARTISYDARRFFGPAGGQPGLMINSGNPDLLPARTHNFDASAEWYDGNVGVIKASVFLKRIRNLTESNTYVEGGSLDGLELPDHPLLDAIPADVFIAYNRPMNNPDISTIWGLELEAERRLTFLPGFLSGLGVYANYTYSDSRKTTLFPYVEPVFNPDGSFSSFEPRSVTRRTRFEGSPRHSGTLGLTYTRPGTDATLYYTLQSDRFSFADNFLVNGYAAPFNSLDLRVVQTLKIAGSSVRLSFEANDLLKGTGDPNTQNYRASGTSRKYYMSGYYHGGRRFALGLSATF
ncbi:TonB-dependent receptor [Sphingomonas colocasiae]|uniref:TonB-dependent receptor n=1 Tax=Sphingomonas colocasiae TaxID=1848973 RepID=A0ABS7PPH6_9SPHN|nr:TonB-dependent receptor [Sphingomonas colocasiae]MBY8823223.1 TonB-dependent receptor [Sphingomonas colocasiae]